MTLQQVIELNNRALALMKQGHFSDAISVISSALKHHRELQLMARYEEVDAVMNSDSDWIDKCMMFSGTNETSIVSTNEFFYRHGISLPYDVVDSTEIIQVLVFNSALANHHLARHHPYTTPQRVLLKAKRLYEIAHELDVTEHNVLFKFAVINNAALIHKALGNETRAKECFDFLMSLMMLFVDRGCSAQLHHIQGFFANLCSIAETAPAA